MLAPAGPAGPGLLLQDTADVSPPMNPRMPAPKAAFRPFLYWRPGEARQAVL